MYNNSENINYCQTQFYLEDGVELVAKKTNLLENSVDLTYKYLLKVMKQKVKNKMN